MKVKHIITSVLIAVCMIFAVACGNTETGSKGLGTPEPTISGATLSWKAVSGAEKYTVTVNGSQYNTEDTTFTITVSAPGDYDIYVTAVKGDEKKTSEKLTYTYTATLGTPTLALNGNVVTWAAIDNATGYEVYVNDALKTTVTLPRYVITEEQVGTYVIKVKAKGGAGYNASEFSASVTYKVEDIDVPLEKLDAPVISLSGRTVEWTAVQNATAYKVYINGMESDTVTDGTSYVIKLRTEGEYTITVSATAPSTDYLASDESNAQTFTVAALDLTKPVVAYIVANGATAEYSEAQGKLVQSGSYDDSGLDSDFTDRTWRFIKVGDYYKIKLANGAYITSAGGASSAWYEAANDGDGQLFELRKTQYGNYNIYNKAVGALLVADTQGGIVFFHELDNDLHRWQMFNVEVEFGADMEALAAPTLSLNDNTVSWTAVQNATAYKVYVNGEYDKTVTETSYVVTVAEQGLYRVTVIATGDGYLNSRVSDHVDYMYSTLDLTQPIYATYGFNGVSYAAGTDDRGYVVPVDASGITDFTEYMWYLEADGEYYNVKFSNGWYLTRVASGNTGPEALLAPKSDGDEQKWKFAPDGFNSYKLSNVSHARDWAGGDLNVYFYGYSYETLKFTANGGWTFENKEISFGNITKLAAPIVELNDNVASWQAVAGATEYEIFLNGVKVDTVTETTYTLENSGDNLRVKASSTADGVENSYLSNLVTYTDLFANPVVARYNRDDYKKVLVVSEADDQSAFGDDYDTISDYTDYLWTVEKLPNGYYMIKLANGKYLSFDDSNSAHYSVKAADKDETSLKQQWKLVPDGESGNAFKLENRHFAQFMQSYYLGEWWGLNYNPDCKSWIFFNLDDNN